MSGEQGSPGAPSPNTEIAQLKEKLSLAVDKITELETAAADAPAAVFADMVAAMRDAIIQQVQETPVQKANREFNSTQLALQKSMFNGKNGQQWEYWLVHAKALLQRSNVPESDWGQLIMGALATQQQQDAISNLWNEGNGPPDWSFKNVCSVMKDLHCDAGTPTDHLQQLENLKPTALTVDGFAKYQAKFLTLSAHVGPDLLTEKGRCQLVLRVLPGLVQTLVELSHKDPSDLAALFATARKHISTFQRDMSVVNPASYSAVAAQPAAAQPGRKQQRQAGTASGSSSPAEGRTSKVQRTATETARPGLPIVPGSTPEEVLARVRAGQCAGCGKKGHRWPTCNQNKAKGQVPKLCSVAEVLPTAELPSSDSAGLLLEEPELPSSGSPDSSALPRVEGRVLSMAAVRRLQKQTKPFESFVGCTPKGVNVPCISIDAFLQSQPEGHILVNASCCSAEEARQLILHVRKCR